MKAEKFYSPVKALKRLIKRFQASKLSLVKYFELNTPITKKARMGRKKAEKNLIISTLSATIIIMEGPTFSVLLRTLKILRQCWQIMMDTIIYNEVKSSSLGTQSLNTKSISYFYVSVI